MAVSPEEVRRALAREYMGGDYNRLCEKYGEDVVVSAFFDTLDTLSVGARLKDIRRNLKRLRRKKRKWRKSG